MSRLIAFTVIVLISASFLFAAGGGGEDASTSPMRVRTLEGCTFLHRSVETDFAHSAERIEAEMKALAKAMNAAKIAPSGPPIVVFHNPTPEAGKTYKVEMGFPVASGVKAPAETKIRQLQSMRAATATFSGPTAAIGEAYQSLYQQMDAKGLKPTEELRQYSLYWEGADSPNNVMLLQVKLAE